jgi:hypothetical protein
MTQLPEAPVQRELHNIERAYARKGYRVLNPARGEALPEFLSGLEQPDLVAERSDDRVVVLVRAGDKLRGSNGLVMMAERVNNEPGWRLELVAVRPSAEQRLKQLDDFSAQAVRYLGLGLNDTAVIVAEAALQEALTVLAWPRDRRVTEKSPERIARDLVTEGLIARADYEIVLATRRLREMALGSGRDAPVTREQVMQALDATARLRAEAIAPAH